RPRGSPCASHSSARMVQRVRTRTKTGRSRGDVDKFRTSDSILRLLPKRAGVQEEQSATDSGRWAYRHPRVTKARLFQMTGHPEVAATNASDSAWPTPENDRGQ